MSAYSSDTGTRFKGIGYALRVTCAMSVNIDIRREGVRPTFTTSRMSVYLSDTGIVIIIIIVIITMIIIIILYYYYYNVIMLSYVISCYVVSSLSSPFSWNASSTKGSRRCARCAASSMKDYMYICIYI